MTRIRRALMLSLLIGGFAWCLAPSTADAAADSADSVTVPDGVALIETTARFEDASEAGIRAAVDRAVDAAVRGAVAMGLSWVQLQHAYVADGYVAVQVLAASRSLAAATDDEPAIGPEPDQQESGTLTRL
jgi:hypothetical protein